MVARIQWNRWYFIWLLQFSTLAAVIVAQQFRESLFFVAIRRSWANHFVVDSMISSGIAGFSQRYAMWHCQSVIFCHRITGFSQRFAPVGTRWNKPWQLIWMGSLVFLSDLPLPCQWQSTIFISFTIKTLVIRSDWLRWAIRVAHSPWHFAYNCCFLPRFCKATKYSHFNGNRWFFSAIERFPNFWVEAIACQGPKSLSMLKSLSDFQIAQRFEGWESLAIC